MISFERDQGPSQSVSKQSGKTATNFRAKEKKKKRILTTPRKEKWAKGIGHQILAPQCFGLSPLTGLYVKKSD